MEKTIKFTVLVEYRDLFLKITNLELSYLAFIYKQLRDLHIGSPEKKTIVLNISDCDGNFYPIMFFVQSGIK